jgi:enediyne biosynthesis protein E4
MRKLNSVWLLVMILCSCGNDSLRKFKLIPSSQSGIDFKNELKETVDFNIINYMYFYNGGGVAVGDVNGDSLLDIYFTANQKLNKLYLNLGNFKFKDITEFAGVGGFKGWTTGVTMADVNDDGLLDIYVSYLGDYLQFKGHNQLFINEGNSPDGIPKFSDQAFEFGLDLVGFSTQASFFDYDKDGDLDMFMLNHSLHQNGTFGKSTMRNETHPLAGDKLLRNDHGRFVNVTKESGIYSSVLGYGLGVVASDVNMDGWMDIYVGNDFHENDYLYINQKDGTFSDLLESSMLQTSRFTMGVDFGDFNNDWFPDLIAVDMLPSDPKTLKSSQIEDTYDVFDFKLGFGYNYQYSRNTLQLNQHNGQFSEIGRMAGVYATDWSWSALWADVDLDGHKDIFVSNGIFRRPNDLDYINFINADSIQVRINSTMTEKELEFIEEMPHIKIPNYLYINNRDSTFTNKSLDWGLDSKSYSNGTAYADFDNDGDLDMVINNIDDEAFLYENTTLSPQQKTEKTGNFIKFVLEGEKGNVFGIGTKILVYQDGMTQLQECMPTRGYQSSVDYRLNFGVAKKLIDSIKVIWPNDRVEVLTAVKPNQIISVKQSNAKHKFDYSSLHRAKPILKDITSAIELPYRHRENKHVEFNREQLMPNMVSAEGPAIAVGDVDGNGTEDIFLGGGKWQEARLFMQTKDGKFVRSMQPMLEADSVMEDVDATFIDVEKDGDIDLLVVSGGNEFASGSRETQPRLYLNDGKGKFEKSLDHLPILEFTHACISPADIDRDGDIDLFIGSRAIPWKYGIPPDSYLLINDGKGKFNISSQADLKQLGLVKKAVWADIDKDGDEDLLVAGEWMPLTILLNSNGNLAKLNLPGTGLQNSNGWWNMIITDDVDHDGDIDFIAGNLGLNSKLKATQQYPIQMYVSDFDGNGTIEQVVTQFIDGIEYPVATRDELTKQMPALKKKFLSYKKFAEASFKNVFSKEQINRSQKFKAMEHQSVVVKNLGNNKFEIAPLPKAMQIAPLMTGVLADFNGDKIDDFFLAGNFYPSNIQMGRYDASLGDILINNRNGNLRALPQSRVGASIIGETRFLRKIIIKNKLHFIAARNNDSIRILTLAE